MISSWENAWEEFVPFLEFPVELRRIVYTTNAIESLSARFRRAVRHRGHFPNEQAAMKVLYLVATARHPNRDSPPPQPREPDRQNQPLEASPKHPDHPLRRQARHHQLRTATNNKAIYTKKLTVPAGSLLPEATERGKPACSEFLADMLARRVAASRTRPEGVPGSEATGAQDDRAVDLTAPDPGWTGG
jgi:hypothetical protein